MSATNVEYVIIGGGFSGIAAATELAKQGKSFVVLEDLDRLGGRNYSFVPKDGQGQPMPGMQSEHGSQYVGVFQERLWNLCNSPEFADWLHKNHPEEAKQDTNVPAGEPNPDPKVPGWIVDNSALRRNYDMQVLVLDDKAPGDKRRFPFNKHNAPLGITGLPNHIGLFNVVGIAIKGLQMTSIERRINVVDPKKSDLGHWGNPVDLDTLTLEKWYDEDWWMPPTGKDTLRIACQALLSIDTTEISPLYLLWYCACNGGFFNEINDADYGPQQYWLRCGFGRILEFLRDSNNFADKVNLQRRVKEVNVVEGGATVTHQKGEDASTAETINCKKVIVAVSPRTCEKIKFPAPLQQKYSSLFAQSMGRTYKCQVYYEKQWWNSIPSPDPEDPKPQGWQGYSGGATWPLLWTMDVTAKDATGNLRPCLMTFTVAGHCDELAKLVEPVKGDPVKTEEVVKAYLAPQISFMFTGKKDYAEALNPTSISSYLWDVSDPTNFIGGGPNTIMKPGLLTGEIGALLDQPYENTIFLAAAETCRNIDPKKPCTWQKPNPPNDPTDPNGVRGYSDNRQDLGYMNGGLTAGQFLAEVAMGKPIPDSSSCEAKGDETLDNFLAILFTSMKDTPTDFKPEDALAMFIKAATAAYNDLKDKVKDFGELFKLVQQGNWQKALGQLAHIVIGTIGEKIAKDLGHAIGVVLAVVHAAGWDSKLAQDIEAFVSKLTGQTF